MLAGPSTHTVTGHGPSKHTLHHDDAGSSPPRQPAACYVHATCFTTPLLVSVTYRMVPEAPKASPAASEPSVLSRLAKALAAASPADPGVSGVMLLTTRSMKPLDAFTRRTALLPLQHKRATQKVCVTDNAWLAQALKQPNSNQSIARGQSWPDRMCHLAGGCALTSRGPACAHRHALCRCRGCPAPLTCPGCRHPRWTQQPQLTVQTAGQPSQPHHPLSCLHLQPRQHRTGYQWTGPLS